MLEGLYDEGLIPFDLAGNIPAAFFRPLVRVLAGELVVTYGKVARLTALKLNAREGRSSLCKLRDEGDDGLPARAVYY